MKKYLWVFGIVVILLLAGLLYFYKLVSIPSGFYVDEATIAYNAISILKTGKDEYGFAYPLVFRLMGSYSPPLFIYLSALLIRFFGSGVLLFRSISAVCAILSVLFFFLLASKMGLYRLKFSYFAITLFYAISPWLVFNARLGYETTFGFILFNIGAYFLFLALSKPKNLIFATLLMSVAAYASYNQRFLAPLFLAIYLGLFRKIFFKKQTLKIVLTAVGVGLITQIPNLFIIGTPAFWTKGNQFGLNYLWMFLTYLSPRTLFYANPDIDLQRTLPMISVMFDWMSIPYVIGVYLMIRRFKDIRYKFLVFYFAVSIIPSVFSGQFVSTQRALPFIIPLAIVIGLGIDQIADFLKPNLRTLLLLPVLGYSLLVLYASYFVLFPKERANAWNYGYDQVAGYIKEHSDKKFLVDDTRNPRTYILLLYFLKVPPEAYQNELGPYFKNNYYAALPMADSFHFANVEVRQIDWREDPQKDLLIIGDDLAVSEGQMKEHGLTKIAEFKDPLRNTIFNIYKTHPN